MKILFMLLLLIIFSCEKANTDYKLKEIDSIPDTKKDTLYYDTKCGCITSNKNS